MKILMVEDDKLTADMYSGMLLKRGYEVTVISDGSEAFQMIHTQDFDFILLDIMLPNMDGLAILRRLRAQPKYHALPILVMTAMSKNTIYAKAMAAGATELLIKDETSLKKLGDTVANLLALQPMRAELPEQSPEERAAEPDFRVVPPGERQPHKLQMLATPGPEQAKSAPLPSAPPTSTTPSTTTPSAPPSSEPSPTPPSPVAPVITRAMVTLKKEPGLMERWFGPRKKGSK